MVSHESIINNPIPLMSQSYFQAILAELNTMRLPVPENAYADKSIHTLFDTQHKLCSSYII